jgi:hypothetical protein
VWVYLGTRDELTTLKAAHAQLEQVFKECSEEKAKNIESAKQDDKLSADNIGKVLVIKTETDKRVSDLKNLPKKSCPTVNTITSGVVNEVPEYVDIDQPFSPDYIKLFSKSNENKRSTNTSTR